MAPVDNLPQTTLAHLVQKIRTKPVLRRKRLNRCNAHALASLVTNMENYRILERLGKGAQGSVYLVVHKHEGKNYVLKQVECNDESEANKAFKEAMALNELQHPYVCGYKEFFVTWDPDVSAMFVCIVMQHYENGDLSKVLKMKRQAEEYIEEEMLKKWLGQMLEALIFVHKKKVIHRDLKPSNIFIQGDLGIAIGDFGVATIMADARTKTRTLVGSMNWMAPEVLDHPYDERSDVWSLGCVVLEMAFCGSCDASQMAGKLYEIKHNADSLEEMLEAISGNYTAGLLSVIRTMLRRKFQQRPTAEELTEMPYIMECLSLSNSALAEKRKRERSAAARRPLPRDKGIPAMVEYLVDNLGNETCVTNSFECLLEQTKENGATMDATGKKIIAKAMKDYMSEAEIQVMGCKILSNLVVTACANDALYSRDVITIVPLAMKSHLGSAALQQAAADLLMAVSADEGASAHIGEMGGVQDVLTALRTFPDDVQLCTTCCNALWSLTVNEDNARIVTEEKGVNDIVASMRKHMTSHEVIEAGEAVLLALSMEDENLDAINKLDCVGLVLESMDKHMREAKVVKNGCMALAAMVEPDEESAYKVLTNVKDKQEIQGIPIIMKAYEQHKDNAEVVENICTLIMELVEYDEILAEIKHLKIHDGALTEIHKRFKDNVDVMKPCESALSKLGGGKVQLRK